MSRKNNELRNEPFPMHEIRSGFPGGRKPPPKIDPIKDHIMKKEYGRPWGLLFFIPLVVWIIIEFGGF